jgi:hypothetical protein
MVLIHSKTYTKNLNDEKSTFSFNDAIALVEPMPIAA